MMREFLFAAVLVATPALGQECIDTELVLLADQSGSISAPEREIIRTGHAAAFRSGDVLDQIAQGACQAIYVTYIEWAQRQQIVVPWTLIDGDESAADFAAAIDAAPKIVHLGGQTFMALAMEFAAEQIVSNGVEGTHRVVDILADGLDDSPISPAKIVERYSGPEIPIFDRITWNGLPVIDALDDGQTPESFIEYFETEIIGGPGARIEPAHGFEDVPRALIKKISREIG